MDQEAAGEVPTSEDTPNEPETGIDAASRQSRPHASHSLRVELGIHEACCPKVGILIIGGRFHVTEKQ